MDVQKKITRKGYLETHLKLMGRSRKDISQSMQYIMKDSDWFKESLRNWRSWYRNKDTYATTHEKDIQNLNRMSR